MRGHRNERCDDLFLARGSTVAVNDLGRPWLWTKRNRREEEERVIPTKVEIRTMIAEVPDQHHPLIVTAIFTGMRIWNYVA